MGPQCKSVVSAGCLNGICSRTEFMHQYFIYEGKIQENILQMCIILPWWTHDIVGEWMYSS